MKIIHMLLSLMFLMSSIASGEVIFSMDCDNGGNITVDSNEFSYNESSGEFSILFHFNNCDLVNGDLVNGTSSISGTFIPSNQTMASISANYSADITITEDGVSRSINCNGSMTGTYDFSTEAFSVSGSSGVNCSTSGTVKENFIELLFQGPLSLLP